MHQLELPPQHPAFVVHVLDAQLIATVQVRPDRGVAAGERERGADPDRRLRVRDRRDRPRQRYEDGDGENLPGVAHGR